LPHLHRDRLDYMKTYIAHFWAKKSDITHQSRNSWNWKHKNAICNRWKWPDPRLVGENQR